MATLGDILKQNKIPLKSTVEPHYRRFSDVYLSLASDPLYSDLVEFETDSEKSIKFSDGTKWTVLNLSNALSRIDSSEKFLQAFHTMQTQLNQVYNNKYTDNKMNLVWTEALTLKQKVH